MSQRKPLPWRRYGHILDLHIVVNANINCLGILRFNAAIFGGITDHCDLRSFNVHVIAFFLWIRRRG